MTSQIAVIAIGPREELRVEIVEEGGKRIISVREWFRSPAGDWRPSKRGVRLKPDVAGPLARALEALKAL